VRGSIPYEGEELRGTIGREQQTKNHGDLESGLGDRRRQKFRVTCEMKNILGEEAHAQEK
jgi:hypothetical protein